MRTLIVAMMATSLLLFLSVAAFGEGDASPVQASLVQASLVANVSTVKAGEPFNVGVLLKIKPGWHVYWKNPGDAGLPTRVQWILPTGFTASELRFPVPRRIDDPGDIVVYGYTDEVLLTSTITPPQAAISSTGGSTGFPITAKVNWLCCSENCVPGKATTSLEILEGEKSVRITPHFLNSGKIACQRSHRRPPRR